MKLVILTDHPGPGWEGWRMAHSVGLDHKPYCGADMTPGWDVADEQPTLGEMVLGCGDCTLKELEWLMAGEPEGFGPLGWWAEIASP